MSDFSKENLNCQDYDTLSAIWESQLRQQGWRPTWTDQGMGWCAPDAEPGEGQSLYDAWRTATGTPDDLKLGIEKEPPAPTYRRPV